MAPVVPDADTPAAGVIPPGRVLGDTAAFDGVERGMRLAAENFRHPRLQGFIAHLGNPLATPLDCLQAYVTDVRGQEDHPVNPSTLKPL
jgi:hypothetical protein